MEHLEQFTWDRATGRGYQWQWLKTTEAKRVRMLTFPTPYGSEPIEWISPMDICASLIRFLAETEPTETGILNFANAYGLLVAAEIAAPLDGGMAYRGNPISTWKVAISEARDANQIWRAVQAGDKKALSKMVKWKSRTHVNFVWGERGETNIAQPENHPDALAIFEPGDVVLPARIMLQRLINVQMQKHVSPQILWSAAEERQGLYLVPHDLLGAIWLQFAEEIDQRKMIARCAVCRTWFERTRTDKEHCSDRCRMRAHRQRKRSNS